MDRFQTREWYPALPQTECGETCSLIYIVVATGGQGEGFRNIRGPNLFPKIPLLARAGDFLKVDYGVQTTYYLRRQILCSPSTGLLTCLFRVGGLELSSSVSSSLAE